MKKTTALIVAGGSGLRMQLKLRKQYLVIGGESILERTLKVFDRCPEIHDIFLVIPENDHDYCRDNILKFASLTKPCTLVTGGDERQESVFNGLSAMNLESEDIVVIHDGVRPFITQYHIRACIEEAVLCGASILAVPVSDTLKQTDVNGSIEKTIDRHMMWAAQTPQVFQYGLIKRAHDLARKNRVSATDDAYLVEVLGGSVRIVPGSRKNFKITTQEDLSIAVSLLGEMSGLE